MSPECDHLLSRGYSRCGNQNVSNYVFIDVIGMSLRLRETTLSFPMRKHSKFCTTNILIRSNDCWCFL